MGKRILVLLVLPFLFLLPSCGSDSGGTAPSNPVATSVTISPTSATLDALGATTQFSATVKDQDGHMMSGASLSWSSDNTAVLTVNASSGLATAVSVGSASVRATSGSASGSASVTVRQVAAQAQVSLAADHIPPGNTTQATLTVADANGHPISASAATWSSSDPTVADVDADGVITGVSTGLAYIRGTAEAMTDSVPVSVSWELVGEQMTVATDASGEAGIYTALEGGAHLQLRVEDEVGQPIEGATVEYGEGGGKAFIAVRRDGYAPAFVFGTVSELKEVGESLLASSVTERVPWATDAAWSPGAAVASAVAASARSWKATDGPGPRRAVSDAIRIRITLPSIAASALSVIQDALQIETFFHKYGPVELGTDGVLWGRKCMTWDDLAQLLISRLSSIPGWADVVLQFERGSTPTFFDPAPVPGGADVYFSAQEVVALLTGDDLLAEKINLLGAMPVESVDGRKVEVEWDFGDSGPPVRLGLGTFRVKTNDAYCGGAVPDTLYAMPPTLYGTPGSVVQAVAVAENAGQAVSGVAVTFTVQTGNGTLEGGVSTLMVTTDGNGKATVSWTLPGALGTYTLGAAADGESGEQITASIAGVVQEAAALVPTETSLLTGSEHTCAITPSNEIYCWGRNGEGQLGINAWGAGAARSTPEAVQIPTGVEFAALAVGGTGLHTCALSTVGYAYCWGWNQYYQIGVDDIWAKVVTPVPVPGSTVFTSIASGSGHNCGLTSDGKAYCWGHNDHGQLGDGTQTDRMTPVPVSTAVSFESVFPGGLHTCGIEAGTGKAYCWGDNEYGQLGIGSTTDQSFPTEVPGDGGFADLAAGWYHTCGVTTAGTAWCWGRNNQAELGLGTTSDPVDQPQRITSVSGFSSITAGSAHTCALTSGGVAYCWGRADQGQLGWGDPAGPDKKVPTLVAGGLTFAVLSAGSLHTCGLTADGTAWCWGDNGSWQLGQGESMDPGVYPVDAPLPVTVKTDKRFGRGN
jgi:alpha-tubulin suppressor-like RCC1 family protein